MKGGLASSGTTESDPGERTFRTARESGTQESELDDLPSGGQGSTPLRLFRLQPTPDLWGYLNRFTDLLVCREWIDFIVATQKATPIFAELRSESSRLGFFIGLMVKRLGLRILGSPFPGWMTPYMGFALYPGVPRARALQALERFAFRDLACVHIEILDRNIIADDAKQAGWSYELAQSYETDLTEPEERLFGNMKSACRRCVRKALRSGVSIEEAPADEGFVEDYFAQLRDGLLKKGLVPSYDARLVRQFIEHLYPAGHLLLLRARDVRGRCIATAIYPAVNGTAHLWGNVASYSDSRHVRPAEALNWYAVKYWKCRGMQRFDWGGLGRYKEKYGGRLIAVPRVRKSRSKAIGHLRLIAENVLRHRLRAEGRFAAWFDGPAKWRSRSDNPVRRSPK